MRKGFLLILLLMLAILADLPILVQGEEAQDVYECESFEYILLEDGTAELTGYYGEDEHLIILSELDGIVVTGIGSRTFANCGSIVSVEIPDTVINIDDFAFYSCGSLSEIKIPDSITQIGNNPFLFCANLTKIVVSNDHPYLATIDGVLYSKPDKRLVCYPMAKTDSYFSIPQGIKTIGNSAFFACYCLTGIEIPDSVTSIGDFAFYSCENLISIKIPDSVTDIGNNPFLFSSKLIDIVVSPDHPYLATINGVLYSKPDKRLVCYPEAKTDSLFSVPDGIKIIGNCAFFCCDNLNMVEIPGSVVHIGEDAFWFCKNLDSIGLPDSVSYIGKNAFDGCNGIVVDAAPGSYAQQYCEENGLNY